MNRVCAVIESLWDTLSFFKLIYGREFINNREKAEKMIEEHQSYIEALKNKDGEKLKNLLSENLHKRIENISMNKDYYSI